MLSPGGCGGRRIASCSGGSTPRAKARQSVGDQVHPEDLEWEQRQGHAQERGGEHHEQLADVGGHEVLDELADVVVDDAAFLDGGHDGGEVVVEQDHVGGFLGHISPGDSHGHADIGLAQSGSVVDSVAGHRRDLSCVLEGRTIFILCSGATRAKTDTSPTTVLQFRQFEAVEVGAGQHPHAIGSKLDRGTMPT